LEEQSDREEQALALLAEKPVTTADGGPIKLHVDTLCLHSDSAGADLTAQRIRQSLLKQGAKIQAFL